LLGAGLCHGDILTVAEGGFAAYATEPYLDGDALAFRPAPTAMIRCCPSCSRSSPMAGCVWFRATWAATFKSSSVEKERWTIEAPALVFNSQEEVQAAFGGRTGARLCCRRAFPGRAPMACPNCTS
jgi:phosphogluconate dehydratase